MFDPDKAYQTRDGEWTVRYLGTSLDGTHTFWTKRRPGVSEKSVTRDIAGAAFIKSQDIVPVVVKTNTFQNIYSHGIGTVYSSRGDADFSANQTYSILRIGLVERFFENGEYAGIVFHKISVNEEK